MAKPLVGLYITQQHADFVLQSGNNQSCVGCVICGECVVLLIV